MLANDKRRLRRFVLPALLLFTVAATAAEPDYRGLALHAGIIFRGTVVAVERVPAAAPGEVPVLSVTFRVDEAVRGATAGQLLTIHQWDASQAGESYRLGETLALFLYPPSGELGLTSTVGGAQGRVSADHAEAALAAAREVQATVDAESEVEPEPRNAPPKYPWVRRKSLHRRPGGDHETVPPYRLPETG